MIGNITFALYLFDLSMNFNPLMHTICIFAMHAWHALAILSLLLFRSDFDALF